ncbi:M48 family metallopeptidase [Curvibacter sp. CHRR-16]|uniref:M48 family metallopeptidase n=1 Tax=Curvibacter sp. CHRR-16 TaxID=2835872 RepID=UPI001BD91748|nr:SprT family zinc-dependent metalloprotease [Curvibacter sp. CHRR-16]MBT0569380.1 M48 family metallopeptidase [Curvibacter sp. CHRR-16]
MAPVALQTELPLEHTLKVYRHPQANREIMLDGVVVAYAFARARRRSIGFTVGADGLSVRAPSWTPLSEVDTALRSKSDWIVRKLLEVQERGQRQQHAQVDWADGATFPYLGHAVQLVLGSGQTRSLRSALLVQAADGTQQLHMGLPSSASSTQVRDAVQAWLMRQALVYFAQRLDHFAPLLQVRYTRLRLSNASTRWGSAKSDGSIRLNWRLIHCRPALIDYVVAHELSHLRVMDHSPRFWDTVASVVPDYAALRQGLHEVALPKWD